MYTKKDKSGYRMYITENSGGWKYTHQRVAEKQIGRGLRKNEVVHHINKNKLDNRPYNLIVMKKVIHKQVHRSIFNEKNACFRCGRTSHWVNNCYAKYNYKGKYL